MATVVGAIRLTGALDAVWTAGAAISALDAVMVDAGWLTGAVLTAVETGSVLTMPLSFTYWADLAILTVFFIVDESCLFLYNGFVLWQVGSQKDCHKAPLVYPSCLP